MAARPATGQAWHDGFLFVLDAVNKGNTVASEVQGSAQTDQSARLISAVPGSKKMALALQLIVVPKTMRLVEQRPRLLTG